MGPQASHTAHELAPHKFGTRGTSIDVSSHGCACCAPRGHGRQPWSPDRHFDRLAIRTARRVTRRSRSVNNARRPNRRSCARCCWGLAPGPTAKRQCVMLAWRRRAMFSSTSLQAVLREPMRRNFSNPTRLSAEKRHGRRGPKPHPFRTAVGTAGPEQSTTPSWEHYATCCPTSWHFAFCLYQQRGSKQRRLRPFGPAFVAVSRGVLAGHCGLAPRASACDNSVKLS